MKNEIDKKHAFALPRQMLLGKLELGIMLPGQNVT